MIHSVNYTVLVYIRVVCAKVFSYLLTGGQFVIFWELKKSILRAFARLSILAGNSLQCSMETFADGPTLIHGRIERNISSQNYFTSEAEVLRWRLNRSSILSLLIFDALFIDLEMASYSSRNDAHHSNGMLLLFVYQRIVLAYILLSAIICMIATKALVDFENWLIDVHSPEVQCKINWINWT